MNFLLDTHVLLWMLFDPERLPKKVRDCLSNPDQFAFVSVLSFWEIALKFQLGKMNLKGCKPCELPHYVEEAGFDILPFEVEDAASFSQLPKLKHKDPFDRMLVWQSIQNGLTLVSKDKGLGVYKDYGLRLFW